MRYIMLVDARGVIINNFYFEIAMYNKSMYSPVLA